MTDYPYEPPEREYQDTILAFRDFDLASTWCVRVEDDWLGPVNKIVTLMRGKRRVKSVLTHVPVGARVELIRDGGYSLPEMFELQKRVWDSRGSGEQVATIEVRAAGWRVQVDGQTVLAVTDAEMAPPRVPTPRVPWRRRARNTINTRVQALSDRVAERLGYHREDNCRGWDE